MRYLIFSLIFLLTFSSCKQVLSLQETIPTVGFRGVEVKSFQPSLELEKMRLTLGLRFLFRNPFNKALSIPEHTFKLELNGDPMPGMPVQKRGFSVPANSERMQTYEVQFNLDPEGNLAVLDVLGKDNVYRFSSSVKLDLSDFLNELEKYDIDLPSNQLTENGKLKNYLNKKLGTRTLEFAFSDTIRLPTLPEIKPSVHPIRVQFTGQMNEINLKALRDPVENFGDVLINESGAAVTDPFLNLLENTEIVVPAPTFTNWARTDTINILDHTIAMLESFSGQGNIDGKWDQLKGKLSYSSDQLAMDQVVNKVLKPMLGNQVGTKWNQFKNQWEAFKAMPDMVRYPGAQVDGLRIEVPFLFVNRNEFAIEAPAFFTDATLNDYNPISFAGGPRSTQQRMIPGGGEREMRLVLNLRWGEANQGILNMLEQQVLQPGLKGETMIDLGYGPIRVPMNLPNLELRMGGTE
ncbi:MAG: hypothetical protein AAF206_02835 [Bacteroidota bacterium]